MTLEVGADAVVRSQLGESSGAAGPLVLVMNLSASVVVVGIIERSSVRENRPGAADGVVQYALHAVAVAGILRDAQQIAGDFEVTVGATRSFKARMSLAQTCVETAGSGNDEGFIGAPSACGVALVLHHAKAVGCGA